MTPGGKSPGPPSDSSSLSSSSPSPPSNSPGPPPTSPGPPSNSPGPPPLRPFGLVLLHDGRFIHEGQPIGNRKLREHFERSVSYLPEESKYIVRLGHFRGEIEVQEAGFFVRSVELADGNITLSDGTQERLDPSELGESPIDGALLCRVKRDLVRDGLLARFMHGAQAELLHAVDADTDGDGFSIRIAGEMRPFAVTSET